MTSRAVNQEVVICHFGSAFSTLTVTLLEGCVHKEIQDEMERLELKGLLIAPKFVAQERVCFKNNHGTWMRARISAVCERETSDVVAVDVLVEDTLETLKRVDGRSFVALPDCLLHLNASTQYFIHGFEPYSFTIGPADGVLAGAQASANALNEQWISPPAGTRLVRRTPLPLENSAKRAKMMVAFVEITRSLTLHEYITNILSDHKVSKFCWKSFNLSNHPDLRGAYGASVHCPYVSKEEVCEVISLRKISSSLLQIGLRLSSYVDTGLFRRMLSFRTARPTRPVTGPLAVSISIAGDFIQRGALRADGQIIGIDTLELFEPGSVEIRPLPSCLCEALPHTGLVIDWDVDARPQTPCLGDMIIVKNLKEDRKSLFHFSYDEISFREPVTLNHRPLKRFDIASQEEDTSEEERENREGASLPPTLAEWYGLEGDLGTALKTALLLPIDPPLEVVLLQFGEAMRI